MKAYDSVLIASYGLHNYFVDGHGLKPHKKPKKMRAKCLCSKSGPKPRNEGRELYRYIKQVSVRPKPAWGDGCFFLIKGYRITENCGKEVCNS